jgi:tetratricopeptide (TPR) repeat protein
MLALIGGLGALSWRQQEVWRTDQAQHRYVVAHLGEGETLEAFTSRQLFLDFMRGDEAGASQAVAAALARRPQSPSYHLVADLIAEKRRVAGYYGRANFLAIIHEQTGLAMARQGDLREANDHFEAALALDDHFYQAAFDRAQVLLRLGRGGEALGSFYLAQKWARPGLTSAQRVGFFYELQQASLASGDLRMAAAAGRHLQP